MRAFGTKVLSPIANRWVYGSTSAQVLGSSTLNTFLNNRQGDLVTTSLQFRRHAKSLVSVGSVTVLLLTGLTLVVGAGASGAVTGNTSLASTHAPKTTAQVVRISADSVIRLGGGSGIGNDLSTRLRAEAARDSNAGLPVVALLGSQQSLAAVNPAASSVLSHMSRDGEVASGVLTPSEISTLAGAPNVLLGFNNVVSDLGPDAMSGRATAPSKAINDSTASPSFTESGYDWSLLSYVRALDPTLNEAETSLGINGAGVEVAVIDSGIDTAAPGLGNGKVIFRDDFSPPDTTGTCQDSALDGYGHGTHVASILAGAPTSQYPGLLGIAPAASLVDLRVFNCSATGTYDSTIMDALQWILDNRSAYPISVVNMSLGDTSGLQDGTDPLSVMVNQVVASGVFVAVAAGNSGDAAESIYSPGTAQFATTVGAAIEGSNGEYLAPFSSQGPTADGRTGVDIVAPGGGITAAGSTATSSLGHGQPLVTLAGTSMATPYVAGVAALVLEQNPSLAPAGTECTYSSSTCPLGVVTGSMTNGVVSSFKTTAMYGTSPNDASGIGLIRAGATLLDEPAVSSQYVPFTLDPNSVNEVLIPAHTQLIGASVLMAQPISTGAFGDFALLNITLVDPATGAATLVAPCAIEVTPTEIVCFAEGGTTRLFNVEIPASSTNEYLALNLLGTTSTTMTGVINFADYLGNVPTGLSMAQGVSLTVSGTTATLTRSIEAGSSTAFTVTTSASDSFSQMVTLPAGPSGSSIQFGLPITSGPMVSQLVNAVSSQEDVVGSYVSGSTFNAAGRVLDVNGNQFTNLNESSEPMFIANTGLILGSDSSTSMGRVAGSDGLQANPFVVEPGSTTAEPLPITQSVGDVTAIDNLALDPLGRFAILGEFPAGAGIVTGDGVGEYQPFMYNLSTNTSIAVGLPTSELPPTSVTSFPYNRRGFKLTQDGSLLFFTALTASSPTVYQLFEENLAADTPAVPLSVPSAAVGAAGVDLLDASTTALVLENTDTGMKYYWNPSTSNLQALNDYGSVVMSPDGVSVAASNNTDESTVCYDGTNLITMTPNMGYSPGGLISVSNGCGSMTGYWHELSDRGSVWHVLQFSKNQTFVELYEASDQTLAVPTFSADGTQSFIVTNEALQPGDTNGSGDIYLGSQTAYVNPTSPVLEGSASIGSTLNVSLGTWPAGTEFSYSWLVNDVPVTSQTGGSLVITPEMGGSWIAVQVTATSPGRLPTFVPLMLSQWVPLGTLVSTPTPTISGSFTPGSILTASPGTWDSGVSLLYQWLRNGVAIPGAVWSTYTVSTLDVNEPISLEVTGFLEGYNQVSEFSTSTTVNLPAPMLLPPVGVAATAISSTDVFVVGRSPQSVLWYQQSSGGGTTWSRMAVPGDDGRGLPTGSGVEWLGPVCVLSSDRQRTALLRTGGCDVELRTEPWRRDRG